MYLLSGNSKYSTSFTSFHPHNRLSSGWAVENPPAMCETQVWSLGWKELLEEKMATHSSILAWRIPWTKELGEQSPWGHKESDTTEQLMHNPHNNVMN